MIINLSENHSLLSNWISELRDVDVQHDRMRFRRNLERIGEVIAYEISKTLPFEIVETQTPLGISNSKNYWSSRCWPPFSAPAWHYTRGC